uniref:Uncharacterized protein n=2 Tax=Palpitomonas bilix TaxID=652834 RepID=A0A7S3GD93_9EUKA
MPISAMVTSPTLQYLQRRNMLSSPISAVRQQLFAAAESDSAENVSKLVEKDPKALCARNSAGLTPLMVAALLNSSNFLEAVLKLGLVAEHEEVVSQALRCQDTDNWRPIHFAAAAGSLNCLRAFCAYAPSNLSTVAIMGSRRAEPLDLALCSMQAPVALAILEYIFNNGTKGEMEEKLLNTIDPLSVEWLCSTRDLLTAAPPLVKVVSSVVSSLSPSSTKQAGTRPSAPVLPDVVEDGDDNESSTPSAPPRPASLPERRALARINSAKKVVAARSSIIMKHRSARTSQPDITKSFTDHRNSILQKIGGMRKKMALTS